jgi:hypothetical protein
VESAGVSASAEFEPLLRKRKAARAATARPTINNISMIISPLKVNHI